MSKLMKPSTEESTKVVNDANKCYGHSHTQSPLSFLNILKKRYMKREKDNITMKGANNDTNIKNIY